MTKPFIDSYNYLRDRYNLTSSYSTFEKNCYNKGFLHDDDDFDMIVMSVLVGMGRIQDAYTEANVHANNYITDLENELEMTRDELGEALTENNVPLETMIEKEKEIKLTFFEKIKFSYLAIGDAFSKLKK